MKTHLGYWL